MPWARWLKSKDGGKNWKVISGFSYDMQEFGLADVQLKLNSATIAESGDKK